MMWSWVKNPRLIAMALIVAAIAAVAFWPEAIVVDVVPVASRDMMVTIDEEGETRVRDRFVISAPVAGRLQRVELEPGDAVKKGDVVARLMPSDAPLLDPRTRAELNAAVDASSAGVRQAQAERARAAATLENARDVLRRRQALVEAGAVSREDLESARTAEQTAASALQAADAAVAQASHQLDLARARIQPSARSGGRAIELRAPAGGVILKRVRESEAVVPAGEPVVEIGDPSRIEIVADLLSTDAVQVTAGAPVLIEQWGGDTALKARVRLVEPSGFMKVSALGVEEQRVNVIIDFTDVAEAAQRLGDAYRVEVRVVTWRGQDVVTVPVGSLFRRGDGWAVFLVRDGRAHLQPVQLGQRNSEYGEILEGLEPGQAVVLHPPDVLTDGARVTARAGAADFPATP